MSPLHSQTSKRAWFEGNGTPKSFGEGEIHEKRVMLSIWLGIHGIYRVKLLPENIAVIANAVLYPAAGDSQRTL